MKNTKTTVLVEAAIMVALATVLSYIRIIKLPWGGSITLLSMLPIVVYSIKRGPALGLAASFVFSLVQFGQGVIDGLFGWGLTPVSLTACIFLDYIGAYTVIGIAGIFKIKVWQAGLEEQHLQYSADSCSTSSAVCSSGDHTASSGTASQRTIHGFTASSTTAHICFLK